ncbi:MAG: hypothetical protein KatS3mg029_0875 [Saprospiraceae bacterium]|jgi:threonine/homoserine/homoserine lactone efflux protein|nr:MAG: hypothetical protein KatS3mg029_0875 [Saprospiraceae bacterium]
MDLLWDGIQYGLILSLLVGPILFTLVQTSIEEGFRAGWMVGLGIWSSDVFYILISYFGVSLVARMMNWDGFQITLCIVGGVVLILFGVGTLLTNPPAIEDFETKAVRYNSYLHLWLRGFVINMANPFTFFFWIAVSSMLFTKQNLSMHEAKWFYTGLVGTLVATDTIKVALAKFIRRYLRPQFIVWPRRVAGVVLIVFGVVLLFRSAYFM